MKVDWLDFVRIVEVAHLLEVKGKEIWGGWRLDGIAFLLEGDEGQWVLINHPKPPKGFVRYEGPLPKVPFKMTVYVGQGQDKIKWRDKRGKIVGVEENERKLWVKAFLEQRKIRRRLERADADKVASEQIEEMVEGLATFVSLKAMEVGSKDYRPIPQIYADTEFSGYEPTLKIQELSQLLRQEDIVHLKGAAQALLLSRMRSSWQREVREGKTLEELLTEIVKDVGDITDLLSEAERFAREKFQEVQLALEKLFTRKVKPPVPHVLIWLYLPKELIHPLRQ